MLIRIQVTAGLGKTHCSLKHCRVNYDHTRISFANLFETVQARIFKVFLMSEDLKGAQLTQTFVGTKADGLMAVSSNETVTVCSQFGKYAQVIVDLQQEQTTPTALLNAIEVMTSSERHLQ